MINYSQQNIDEEDIAHVLNVLKSGFLTQGPQVPFFEEKIKEYVGVTFAFAMNSATSALHCACMALDVGPGDLVWTTPNSFVASANCALYCGATIDFVDIELDHYNICTNALREKLEKADSQGLCPKVLIPVHFAGHPADMQEIHRLSKQYGFYVIEDASHAIGAKLLTKLIPKSQKNAKSENEQSDEDHIGSCKYSDITIFSFHPVKIITTAEGGIATTNNPELAEKLSRLRSHGIRQITAPEPKMEEQPWRYDQVELGYNYRMSDVNASLGMSQLRKVNQFVLERNSLADYYDTKLEKSALRLPKRAKNVVSSVHLYPIWFPSKEQKLGAFKRLLSENIKTNVHYIPIHLHSYYYNLGFRVGDFPKSEVHYEKSLSVPLFPSLRLATIDRICEIIMEVTVE